MNRGRHKKQNKHLKCDHLVVQILGSTIANRLMECQKEHGNIPNLDIFLNTPAASKHSNGFNWSDTKEGWEYWNSILIDHFRNHSLYLKYQNDRSKRFY
jgi:hypothetical protein